MPGKILRNSMKWQGTFENSMKCWETRQNCNQMSGNMIKLQKICQERRSETS